MYLHLAASTGQTYPQVRPYHFDNKGKWRPLKGPEVGYLFVLSTSLQGTPYKS